MKFQATVLIVALGGSEAFQAPFLARKPSSISWKTASSPSLPSTPLFASGRSNKEDQKRKSKRNFLKRILDRVDTIESAGLEDVKVAGLGDKIKSLHGPKTYLLLALAAGLKWKWCFRSPYYWFGVAFCVKWYRARYVFKIPVWDRQPNWNNIITSKEQEKDLKAFTCKNCGSTIFIAKTREFFFEGDTGIGGLGCFSCGAKGKDNFVMDRDRIVQDIADVDDYFEYERPLDFVSRAERRKLLKEAGGDEDKANEILMARSGTETEPSAAPAVSSVEEVTGDVNAEVAEAKDEATLTEVSTDEVSLEKTSSKPPAPLESNVVKPKPKTKAPKEPSKAAPSTKPQPSAATADDDDLDVLGMD